MKGTKCFSVGLNMRRASSLSLLLRLCIGGSRVAWDDSDAGAVDLVGQLHQPPEHDGGEEGAAGRGDPVHGARGGHGDGEAGRDLELGNKYLDGQITCVAYCISIFLDVLYGNQL